MAFARYRWAPVAIYQFTATLITDHDELSVSHVGLAKAAGPHSKSAGRTQPLVVQVLV